MAILIVLIPTLILVFLVNERQKKRGKRQIPEGYTMPFALFLIMCFITYELRLSVIGTFIIFNFGILIGSLIEFEYEKNKKKGRNET